MQLPLTADVIAALGVGAAVLAALVVLVLVLRRRKRTDGAPEPSAADWTGEIAGADAPSPRRTVAEVVAGRDADTAPSPVSSSALLARRGEPAARAALSPERGEGAEQPPPAESAVAESAVAESAVAESAVAEPAVAEPAVAEPTAEPREAEPAPVAEQPAQPAAEEPEHPAVAGQQAEESIAADLRPAGEHPDGATPPADRPPADRPPADRSTADRVGSGRTVAAAVAQAFAVRAAAGRPPERSPADPVPQGDVRDRLLAVLLDDPVRAVGATQELEACRGQLDRLSDALHHERGVLSDVLSRLADTGLRPDQLARLAGLPLDEVYALVVPDRSRRP